MEKTNISNNDTENIIIIQQPYKIIRGLIPLDRNKALRLLRKEAEKRSRGKPWIKYVFQRG